MAHHGTALESSQRGAADCAPANFEPRGVRSGDRACPSPTRGLLGNVAALPCASKCIETMTLLAVRSPAIAATRAREDDLRNNRPIILQAAPLFFFGIHQARVTTISLYIVIILSTLQQDVNRPTGF
jgi:hypothetical protein